MAFVQNLWAAQTPTHVPNSWKLVLPATVPCVFLTLRLKPLLVPLLILSTLRPRTFQAMSRWCGLKSRWQQKRHTRGDMSPGGIIIMAVHLNQLASKWSVSLRADPTITRLYQFGQGCLKAVLNHSLWKYCRCYVHERSRHGEGCFICVMISCSMCHTTLWYCLQPFEGIYNSPVTHVTPDPTHTRASIFIAPGSTGLPVITTAHTRVFLPHALGLTYSVLQWLTSRECRWCVCWLHESDLVALVAGQRRLLCPSVLNHFNLIHSIQRIL